MTLTPSPKQRRGDARAAEILRTTMVLLRDVGYGELTIDAVAARADASKTTIYRRWADKPALVSAALVAASDGHPTMPSHATSLRDDLRALVALMAGLGATEHAGTFADLLAAARTEPAIAEAVRVTALEPRRQDCRDVVQRAIGRGELRNPRLATVLFDLTIGQTMVRFLLQGDGFDDTGQAEFVEQTLIPVLTAQDTPARGEDGNRDTG